ncbi:MAG: hypothetical protein CVV25_03645 [Ignavibacteriae bacterium HGW-Ignavibacteriae-4]|nr:MAG: hypothetical protein CVV25_03645 [Ignavibacteriae bacterium HGW-Ignavibacteriae-4]
MRFLYTFTFLLILIHTNCFSSSKKWEVIDNNTSVKNPNGHEFYFKSFEMEELYGIFYAVNLNNTNGILSSTNLARRWDVAFYETYNTTGASNIIYDLIKQGNQLYAPSEPGSVHILNSKTQEWNKIRVSNEFNEPVNYLQFVNDSVGFIGFQSKYGFYKTTNKGLNWQPFRALSSSIPSNFIFVNSVAKSENELYMVGNENDSLTFYKTSNGGNTWTKFQSDLFEKSDLVSQSYYNLKYEKPYFFVENRYKQLKDGKTTLMRSTDFIEWEPVFISDFVDFGKFIHSFKFYGNYGFALGTQVFLFTEDGGDTWVDLYDENDIFYDNKNPINGFFLYDDYLYASGAIEELDENGGLTRVNKFFKYDTKNLTSVYENRVNISIYPNPSESFINILSKDMIESYDILDLSGKVVAKNTIALYQNNVNIDIEDLSKGTYFIRINENLYKRFVKQ